MRPRPILFAPLDDMLAALATRPFEDLQPLLEFVKQERIPLILCSAKTRTEMEPWRDRLGVFDPFVSESGGGVFIPYDSIALHDLQAVCPRIQITSGYYVLVLGTPQAVLAGMLDMIKAEGFEIRGSKDMDVTEVMQLTGLNRIEATRTMRRDFEEPFLFSSHGRGLQEFFASVQLKGLRCAPGDPFHHLTGKSDTGKAVALLSRLYERKFGSVFTIGIGDSLEHLPLLEKVNLPILVRNQRGEQDPGIVLKNLVKTDGVGLTGWREAFGEILLESSGRMPGCGASRGPGEKVGTA